MFATVEIEVRVAQRDIQIQVRQLLRITRVAGVARVVRLLAVVGIVDLRGLQIRAQAPCGIEILECPQGGTDTTGIEFIRGLGVAVGVSQLSQTHRGLANAELQGRTG